MDDLSPEAFERQLQYMCERLSAARPNDNVIFDRSPLDFLAYLRAIEQLRLGTSDWVLAPGVLEGARIALRHLHILVLVRPASSSARARPRRGLRGLVDDYLSALILRDALDFLGDSHSPEVIELAGSTSERLRQLNQVVARKTIPLPKRPCG